MAAGGDQYDGGGGAGGRQAELSGRQSAAAAVSRSHPGAAQTSPSLSPMMSQHSRLSPQPPSAT